MAAGISGHVPPLDEISQVPTAPEEPFTGYLGPRVEAASDETTFARLTPLIYRLDRHAQG